MKKTICILLCAVMLLTIVSCTENPTQNEKPAAYQFSYDGVKIAVDADVAPILNALGECRDYYESPSCYFTGTDKIYTYAGFELHTYPEGEKNFVYLIRLYDDTVATAEGIRIGSSRAEVIEAYGEPDTENVTSLLYACRGMYLEIFLGDGTVEEIQYQHPKVKGE